MSQALLQQKKLSSWWLNQPIGKNMLVKFGNLPQGSGENEKYLSCHHHMGVSKNGGTPKWMV